DLVGIIEAQGVPAIFTDATESARLSDAIARELGDAVAVVPLYTGALGEAGSGADTLITMLTTNARRIAEALS
ncbi:MAG: zinc ABC transporter substrate-binding protein, partial [Acidimicrobiia bacterium]|nr:zinc ABC transporter substrate-binding protein [Acidimicrobiia bacterium]